MNVIFLLIEYSMRFITWTFKTFFWFSGRLNRRGYWFYGFIFPFVIATFIIQYSHMVGIVGLYIWYWVFLVLSIKRLHDQNHTGFWVLLGLIPYINFVLFLDLLFMPGTKGPNRHGPFDKKNKEKRKRHSVEDDWSDIETESYFAPEQDNSSRLQSDLGELGSIR